MTTRQMLVRLAIHIGCSGMFYIFMVAMLAGPGYAYHPEQWEVFHPYLAMFILCANIAMIAWTV